MSADKPPGAPRQVPVRVPLGTFERKGVTYEAQLVVTSPRLATLIAQAMANRDGRAEVAGGGVAVLAKRVHPPRPPAEASAPPGELGRSGGP